MPPPPARSSENAPVAESASPPSPPPSPLVAAVAPPPPAGVGDGVDDGPIDLRKLPWPRRLAFVIDMMRDLSRQTRPQDMVRTYGQRMRKVMPSDASISLSRRGLSAPQYRITRSNKFQEPVDPWKQPDKLPLLSGGLLARLLYANEPTVIDDLDLDPADPAHDYLVGHRSLVAIPLYDGGEALNMVLLLRAVPAGYDRDLLPEHVWMSNLFGRAASNLVLAEEVKAKALAAKAAKAEAETARDAAQAAEEEARAAQAEAERSQAMAEASQAEAERAYDAVDRELKAVADIQRSLLPAELPAIPGLDVAAFYQTSKRAGGDYYDFFPLPNGRWGILVADVSGHGTPAAVLMAITHSIAHAGAGDSRHPASRMLASVNARLAAAYTSGTGNFVTAFYGVWDPAAGTLSYASAGHQPPRVRRADGTIEPMDGDHGLPLGIDPDEAFPDNCFRLAPGDAVVFYTDGITEARAPDGEMFETDRLDAAVAAAGGAGGDTGTAADLLGRLLATVDAFAGGVPPGDDRTVLVAAVTGAADAAIPDPD